MRALSLRAIQSRSNLEAFAPPLRHDQRAVERYGARRRLAMTVFIPPWLFRARRTRDTVSLRDSRTTRS
jgi:hypothetical protein